MSSSVRFADSESDKQPTRYPGCGDFGMMNGIMKTLADSGTGPDNTFMIVGTDCSGKTGTYMRSYATHGVHGRSLPIAAGVKLANPNLIAVTAGDDDDGHPTGAGHFVHAIRRNVGMAYTVMGNRIYGLARGQASPTSREDLETSTTLEGPQQSPVNPFALSLAASDTFITQSFTTDRKRHAEIVQGAIERDGFSFMNMFSPCVTFNDVGTYDYFHNNLVDLADTDHDPTDCDTAEKRVPDPPKEYEDIIHEDESPVSYGEKSGVGQDTSDIPSSAPDDVMDLVREFH